MYDCSHLFVSVFMAIMIIDSMDSIDSDGGRLITVF